MPVATHLGIDSYHLGFTFLVNLEIAHLVPPLGLNLIISSFRCEKPVTEVYRSVLPFIAVLVVTLGLVTYLPFLSTYLPSFSKATDLAGGRSVMAADQNEDVPMDDEEVINLDELDEVTLDDLEVAPSGEDAGSD